MLGETLVGLILGMSGVAATNVDNVIILVGTFGGKKENTGAVCLGFATGALVILAISLVSIFVDRLIPVEYLGYLGVIPIFFGLRSLMMRDSQGITARAYSESVATNPLTIAFAASTIMVAAGVDTITVFAPLLAESKTTGIWAICSGYLMAVLALCAFIGYACNHPALATPLQKYGSRIGPVVMVLIGIYILVNTATDTLPD